MTYSGPLMANPVLLDDERKRGRRVLAATRAYRKHASCPHSRYAAARIDNPVTLSLRPFEVAALMIEI